ncbi:DUF3311 domain-containing protein [Streptomyces avermitilis]|uniref:DUF3311 domain-containing protein n=1 Tax=Streptomyces avermitilis TaxID=33903 RepID=UPI0033A10ED7
MKPRPHHLWLLTPFVLFLGVLPLVNRVDPVVLGLPFLFLWLLGATVLTPLAVWMTWRKDREGTRHKDREGMDREGMDREGTDREGGRS